MIVECLICDSCVFVVPFLLIFINCHLAGKMIYIIYIAGQKHSNKRNNDFERINKELQLDNFRAIDSIIYLK